MMQRRHLLAAAAAIPLLARAEPPAQRLALAWRLADGRDQAGLLALDWAARRMDVLSAVTLPSRGHGLIADGRGGFYAVAARTGDWLLHVAADGLTAWARQDGPWRFNGHLLLHAAGLFATETDPRDDSAHLALRDPVTLALIFRTALNGRDGHQLVTERDGRLLLALGGLPRGPDGRKREGAIASALLRLDPASGRELGRWRLDDADISLRHLAWSHDGRQLGIALQAEHVAREPRLAAPLLALFDGERLTLPAAGGAGQGYAGDLCAAPGGGFVLSAQKAGLNLLWRPDEPATFMRVAELTEPCALHDGWHDGERAVLMVAGRGVARWQARGAQMLAWPQPMVPDNHAVLL
jgi:hypothetical protein